VRAATEFDSAFSARDRERAGAVLVLSTPLFMGKARPLAELALTHKLPTIFGSREHVEAGGLLSYSPDHAGLYHHAAIYAKTLGLTIPQSLLGRADEVIQ
jgi:putative ABC transport system substrate-binding protein